MGLGTQLPLSCHPYSITCLGLKNPAYVSGPEGGGWKIWRRCLMAMGSEPFDHWSRLVRISWGFLYDWGLRYC